jgi:hypothetical protein
MKEGKQKSMDNNILTRKATIIFCLNKYSWQLKQCYVYKLVSNFSIIEKFKQQKIIWINKTSTRNTSYNISSISGFLDKPRRLTRWTNQKEKTSSVVNAVHQPLKCLNVNVKNQKKKPNKKQIQTGKLELPCITSYNSVVRLRQCLWIGVYCVYNIIPCIMAEKISWRIEPAPSLNFDSNIIFKIRLLCVFSWRMSYYMFFFS